MLIHNNVLAALDQANIGEDFDFWSYVPQLKDGYLKFFKAYKKRCSNVLAHYRVLPVDEEASTTGTVTGMITTWQKRTKLAKQQHSTVKFELQFLAHHKQQYNELGDDFASNSHALKSRTALENFKLLIELDIKILLGADVQWSVPGKDPQSPRRAPASAPRSSPRKNLRALPSAKSGDDGSSSSESGGEKEKEGAGAAIGSGDSTAGVDGSGCTSSGDGGAGPGAVSGDGGAGGEIEGAGGAGDDISGGGGASGKAGGDIIHATPISADDFTTWSPVNWSSVPWMQVTLDKDSPVFLAATMAFTDPSLRKSHQAFNRSLSSAWDYVPKLGDFNIMMDGLKTQLTEDQRLWLTGTLGWIKNHKWIETGTARTIPRLAGGKRRKADIVEEDDLPHVLAKQVPAAAPKRARGTAPEPSW